MASPTKRSQLSPRISYAISQHRVPTLPITANYRAFEEQSEAEIRSHRKQQKVDDFVARTKMNVVVKQQQVKEEKMKHQEETSQKIKKLLENTIEFSQKTIGIGSKAWTSCANQLSGMESAEKKANEDIGPEKSGEVILEVDMRLGGIKERTDGVDLGNEYLNAVLREIEEARERIDMKIQQSQNRSRTASPDREGDSQIRSDFHSLEKSEDFMGRLTSTQKQEITNIKDMISKFAMNKIQPRDFETQIPILTTLGADRYDMFEHVQQLRIQVSKALKKFVTSWKTLDKSKIDYLMKYSVVQEVMKVEERKAVRREKEMLKAAMNATKSQMKSLQEEASPDRNLPQTRDSSPDPAKASDIVNKSHNRDVSEGGRQSSLKQTSQLEGPKSSVSTMKYPSSYEFADFMPKEAPTVNNPAMKRMDRQGATAFGHKKSSVGFDTSSRRSKSRRTVSQRSKENLDDMSVEELDALIEKAKQEIDQCLDIEKRVKRHKMMTNKAKQKKMAPVRAQRKELEERVFSLEEVKDKKIPFYEKLPKDSPFYKHYVSILYAKRMNDVACQQANDDKLTY